MLVGSSLQTDIDGRGFDPEHQLQYKEPIEVLIFTSTDALLSPKMGDYVKKGVRQHSSDVDVNTLKFKLTVISLA